MYCTNVHAAQTAEEVLAMLGNEVATVATACRGEGLYSVGLRLSAQAARAFRSPERLAELKRVLAENRLEVRHINAFPYGVFHGAPVREGVYFPDWSTTERVAYTVDVCTILAELLPEGGEGTVTTVPIGYGARFSGATFSERYEAACRGLDEVNTFLAELEKTTHKRILLAIEPEPDCLVEDAQSFVRWIRPASHRGVCLDTCHAAVMGEDLMAAVHCYQSAGFPISRIQVSAALRSDDEAALAPFLAESVYLHQRRGNRIHYHVPLCWDGAGPLESTRDALTDEFLAWAQCANVPLEIETYTYDVMPQELRGESIVQKIVEEEKWLADRLKKMKK